MDLSAITHCKIHPAIGIARVGNSPEGSYDGPEVPGRPAPAPESVASPYKDDQGRLLRMACRFRVFGYNDAGEVVGEVTADAADIAWTAHVANAKSAWYGFQLAMDIPEASVLAVPLRNASEPDRSWLVNDPGAKSISGADADPVAIEGGAVFGIDVALGELRTDDEGRLLFLGGHGVSASATDQPATTFANNEGWYDDTSDGSIDAKVVINGNEVPVTGAWVVTAPPDYGPGTYDITTMWDVVFDVATQIEPRLRPAIPSFERDIYPIFDRFSGNQWVNAGFAEEFGWKAPLDFSMPKMRAKLRDKSSSGTAFRSTLFAAFRDPRYGSMQPGALPPMYGDGMDVPPKDPRQWQAVTELQHAMLAQWAAGDFTTDEPPWAADFDNVPVAEQPRSLDQAALEACLGGPFHPGCEITWPMRVKLMYDEPLRVKRRTEPEAHIGATLTQSAALSRGGPLDGSHPGDLSRWMAVPWQTDTSSCLYAYVGYDIGLFLPTFWPARVPNNVITEDQYAVIMSDEPQLDRLNAFAPKNRAYWLRKLGSRSDQVATINQFVKVWGETGVVAPLDGPEDDPAFPVVIHVETGNTAVEPEPTPTASADGELEPAVVINPRHYR